jgi:hypothetical protein
MLQKLASKYLSIPLQTKWFWINMANNFIADPSCKALWMFEPGDDFLTDSVGENTWDAYEDEWNKKPISDAVVFFNTNVNSDIFFLSLYFKSYLLSAKFINSFKDISGNLSFKILPEVIISFLCFNPNKKN